MFIHSLGHPNWPETPSRTRRRPVVLFPAAVLAVFSFSGCGQKQAAAPAIPPVPVVVAQAIQKSVPVEVRAIGNVEAYSTVSIKAQVTGPVTAVHFQEGQDVRKGELLFEIDRRPFDVALEQAQADLARDTARAQNARVQANRYAKLFEEGVAAKDQYDAVHAEADALGAAVQADRALIEKAKLDLQYCSIHSPVDGRTGNLMVHPGNLVKANDVPILVIINQITPIYTNFAIPEQYLAEVRKFMALGKLRVLAQPPDDPSATEQGALSFVDNAVDSATGTIRMKATFANPRRKLWPGQFVNVVLTLSEQRDAVVVPAQAINVGQNGSFVYVIKSDETAEMRPVTPGRTVGGETIVEKGIQPGETVVTDGQLRLVSGARVTVKPAAEQR